jgi:hypothetical protein
VLNGKGYVLGGIDGLTGTYTNALHAFDPGTGQWVPMASHPWQHIWAAPVFTIDTLAYTVGGASFSANTQEVHAYDPETDTWSPRGDFPGPQTRLGWGCSLNGTGYVCLRSLSPVGQRFWAYDPLTDSWTSKADPPSGSGVDGHLVVLGGVIHHIGNNGTVWAYDVAMDEWMPRANRGASIQWPQVFTLAGRAYTVSGLGTMGPVDDVHRYDPVMDQWDELTLFTPQARTQGFAFVLDDRAYVGSGLGGGPTTTYFSDVWSTIDLSTNVELPSGPPSTSIHAAQGAVYVHTTVEGPHRLDIYDARGALLTTRSWSGSDLIAPLEGVGPGVYLVSVRSANGLVRSRVIAH